MIREVPFGGPGILERDLEVGSVVAFPHETGGRRIPEGRVGLDGGRGLPAGFVEPGLGHRGFPASVETGLMLFP